MTKTSQVLFPSQLFVFNMLLLVLGDNLLVMFVGWEGVGLASHLLIGFWFDDPAKSSSHESLITNRIGDAGFLLGMFILFVNFGTIEFSELTSRMPEIAEIGWNGPITLACLFLFIGAMGKSTKYHCMFGYRMRWRVQPQFRP